MPLSREYLGTEVDAVLELTNEIATDVAEGRTPGLTVERIHEFNRRLLDGQPVKPDVIPGKTRSHSVAVGISSYRGAPAEDCEYLLQKLVDWLNDFQAPGDKPELRFPIAILKAIIEVSDRVAGEYAGSGHKTLTRDIHELEKRGLLVRAGNEFVTNRQIVDAFLPPAIPGAGRPRRAAARNSP